MYQRALIGKEKALGPEHTSTLNTVYAYGNIYIELNRVDQAKAFFERARDGYIRNLGPEYKWAVNAFEFWRWPKDKGKWKDKK